MSFKRVAIILVPIIIALAFFFTWTLVRSPRVSYLTMELDEAIEILQVSGRVIDEGAVPLAFQKPGQLFEIMVQEGDIVSGGDLLAVLDDRQANSLIQQAENQLSSAEVLLSRLQNRDLPRARETLEQAENKAEIAESVYESSKQELLDPAVKRLDEAEKREEEARQFFEEQERKFADGEIGLDELIKAQDDLDLAVQELEAARSEEAIIVRQIDNLAREKEIAFSEARSARLALQSLENEEIKEASLSVDRAQDQLDQARLELELTKLESPFGGMVVRLTAFPGQFVAAGQEICTIIPDDSSIYVEAQVEEGFFEKIETGQEALVSTAAFPDQIFAGRVDWVSPTVDLDRGTFQVRFVLDQFQAGLLPGLAASVEVVIRRVADSLILGQQLTFQENDRIYVFIEVDGKVARRQVTVEDLGREFYLVKEGLQPGDRVLLDLSLEEGQRIRLTEAVGGN